MKRRSFVKKSVASAIVMATPMALTGLVNAAGGGTGGSSSSTTSPSSTTGWFGTTYAPETTTVPETTTWFETTSVPESAYCRQEEGGQKYQSIDGSGKNVCWFKGNGFDPNRSYHHKNYVCAMGVEECHQIVPGVSTPAQIEAAKACMVLPYGFPMPEDRCELIVA